MKKFALLAVVLSIAFGVVGTAFAECPGGAHKKTTADTTTTQDVKKGS
jgi:hypothetical protein